MFEKIYMNEKKEEKKPGRKEGRKEGMEGEREGDEQKVWTKLSKKNNFSIELIFALFYSI